MRRIPVGILGATGMVGQRFIQLLADHPWFEVRALAASDRSAGKRYADSGRWLLPRPMPEGAQNLVLHPLNVEDLPDMDCRLVFSALPSSVAGPIEETMARAGYAVCSNSAPHRLDPNVPLLVPEVNSGHTALIAEQRRERGGQGFITTSANCSTTELVLALKPLHHAFGLRRIFVVTLQAISGAGYPGVPALDILGNVIPFIDGEEDKIERESRKLLGRIGPAGIQEAAFTLSAQCNRVPVADGHTECVSAEFDRRPTLGEVLTALHDFKSPPEAAELPSSPAQPILVRPESDRPQPLRDCQAGQGMAVSVGRVRPCPLLHYKFVLLGHNTVRGAAGGAIHNAELLVAQKWIVP
jgi:aspartate-semialdehyde dehydrogenase